MSMSDFGMGFSLGILVGMALLFLIYMKIHQIESNLLGKIDQIEENVTEYMNKKRRK